MLTIRPRFRRAAKIIVDILAPPVCAFCATPCDATLCCSRCAALLPRNEFACSRCANPLPHVQQADVWCAVCQVREPPFHGAAAPLLYEFPVDTAIKALKFRRQLFYVPVFGAILLKEFERRFSSCDGLVAVPLHRVRHAFRGFNQAHELCRIVRRRTGLPIAANVRRIRSTKVQSGLAADERSRNLRGAFAVKGLLRSRRPLIVDDVMTTGQTCSELARTLLKAGADEVSVLTIARARQAP